MLTAEQLYEIIIHKDDSTIGPDGQPRNRAASALYSLWEDYRKRNAANVDALDFSEAMTAMMEKAEQVIRQRANKELFVIGLQNEVAGFQAAYNNLPPQLREQGTMKETFDIVSAVKGPEEGQYERDMADLMENLIMVNDTVKSFRFGTHPAKLKLNADYEAKKIDDDDYNDRLDDLEAMEQANQDNLKATVATILAKDNLRRNQGLRAAVTPKLVDALAQRMLEHGQEFPEFTLIWNAINQKANNAEGLKAAFNMTSRTDLANRIDPAAEAVENRLREEAAAMAKEAEDKAKEAAEKEAAQTSAEQNQPVVEKKEPVVEQPQPSNEELEYQKMFHRQAEKVVRIKEHLEEVANGGHGGQPKPGFTVEDYQHSVACLAAMDNLHGRNQTSAALNPALLKDEIDQVMQKKGISILTASLNVNAGEKRSLEGILREWQFNSMADAVGEAETKVHKETKDNFFAKHEELAKNAIRIKGNLDQLREGTHETQRSGDLTLENYLALRQAYTKNLKENLASLIALDNFRRTGEFNILNDPDRLQTETDRIMGSKRLDAAIATLSPESGEGKTLEKMFRELKKGTLVKTFAAGGNLWAQAGTTKDSAQEEVVAPEPGETEKKQNVEAGENVGTEPEPVTAEQESSKAPWHSDDSPIVRFFVKLEKLREELEASKESILYTPDTSARSQDLLELFALRDLGKTAPLAPVSDDDVNKRMKEIRTNQGGNLEYALYQNVLRQQRNHQVRKQLYEEQGLEYTEGDKIYERLLNTLQSGQNTKEFIESIEKVTGLNRLFPQNSSIEKAAGPNKPFPENSPAQLFQDKLKELRADIAAADQDGAMYSLNVVQCRKGMAYLIALRDLGKTDPLTPVSEIQVNARANQIYNAKGNPEYALYQKLDKSIRSGNFGAFRRVVGKITGGESADEFAAAVSEASGIKLENAAEKAAGPTL